MLYDPEHVAAGPTSCALGPMRRNRCQNQHLVLLALVLFAVAQVSGYLQLLFTFCYTCIVIWLLLDLVCYYQPSDWLRRPGFWTNQVIGWGD